MTKIISTKTGSAVSFVEGHFYGKYARLESKRSGQRKKKRPRLLGAALDGSKVKAPVLKDEGGLDVFTTE